MKTISTLIAICIATLVNAQVISFNPRTGDVEMDNVLKDINVKAQADINLFKQDISVKFEIAKNKIENLLTVMAPGDIYMAAEVSNIIHKPIETVSETYSKNKGKGWGEIAKELGIKPGSKEFHEMKAKFKGKGKSKDKAEKGKPSSSGKGKGKK